MIVNNNMIYSTAKDIHVSVCGRSREFICETFSLKTVKYALSTRLFIGTLENMLYLRELLVEYIKICFVGET